MVEADDHARHHLDAGALDAVHRVEDASAQVLRLVRLLEARGARRLDADEDRREVRLAHQLQQLVVLGDVERDLGHQLDRVAVGLLPFDERVQQLLGFLLVPDEVVVDDEDVGGGRAGGSRGPRPSPARPSWCAARRPYMTMMSQNSQLNGQPRANWIVIVRYRSIFSRSKRGSGESCMLGFSTCRYSGFQLPGRVVLEKLRPGVLGLVDEDDVDPVAQLLGAERGERARRRRRTCRGAGTPSAMLEDPLLVDDVAGQADDVRVGVEVDRLDVLVAEHDLVLARRDARRPSAARGSGRRTSCSGSEGCGRTSRTTPDSSARRGRSSSTVSADCGPDPGRSRGACAASRIIRPPEAGVLPGRSH